MNYVIDRNGNRKQVPPGYILQSEESMDIGVAVRVPMLNMDGSPGRTFLTDAQPSGKIGIGDAASINTVDGSTVVRFQDGTGALKRPDGSWLYTDGGGYIARSHSREQQAHAAKVAGTFGQWVDDFVDRKASEIVAYQGYVDSLNAWRNS